MTDGDHGPAPAPAHRPAQVGPAEPPFVTLAEASALTGRSVVAVRAALRRDLARPERDRHLRPRKGNDGQWRIIVPAAWTAQAGAPAGPSAGRYNGHGPAHDAAHRPPHAPAQAGRPDHLAARLDAAERERDELRGQVVELRVALARAEAERDAVREAAEDRGATHNAVIEELRAELARLRLPFWRRWLG